MKCTVRNQFLILKKSDFMQIPILIFIVNIYTFILFRMDKYGAKKGKTRISEKSLILHALFLGSIGAMLGMCVPSKHKTNKYKFSLGIPTIFLIQLTAGLWYYFKFSA